MSTAVLDPPVAPTAWVNEKCTSGDLSVEYLATSAAPLAAFLQRAGRMARVPETSSYYLVAERYYVGSDWMGSDRNPDFWHLRPAVATDMTQTSTDIRVMPPALNSQLPIPASPALQAADDLRGWLHLTYDDIALMSGLGKRTIHHWRATGAQPRPATAKRLLEIRALVNIMRHKLSPNRATDWFRTGAPSPLQMLREGNISAVQEAAHEVLFRQPQQERALAGHNRNNPEIDLEVNAHGIIAPIEQQFVLLDRTTVVKFLEAHPYIAPILLDLAVLIPECFAGAVLFLRVVDTASTGDAPDGQRLVLFIGTNLGEEQAMDQMDRLMAAWRPDVRSRTGEAFSIDLAFGTTAADAEAAAQRFIQSHSSDHKAYRELARRLLNSKPGSVEEGVVRAELAASLAGGPEASPVGGGDALAVLARLRRQAATQ